MRARASSDASGGREKGSKDGEGVGAARTDVRHSRVGGPPLRRRSALTDQALGGPRGEAAAQTRTVDRRRGGADRRSTAATVTTVTVASIAGGDASAA